MDCWQHVLAWLMGSDCSLGEFHLEVVGHIFSLELLKY